MDARKLVLKQTGIVALGEAIGVALVVGVFALLGGYDSSVLLGGVIGGVVAVANFFFMALSINIAANKAEEENVKGGQATVRSSYFLRMLVMLAVLFAFAKSGLCNVIALVVPLVFVRPTLTIADFFERKPGEKKE